MKKEWYICFVKNVFLRFVKAIPVAAGFSTEKVTRISYGRNSRQDRGNVIEKRRNKTSDSYPSCHHYVLETLMSCPGSEARVWWPWQHCGPKIGFGWVGAGWGWWVGGTDTPTRLLMNGVGLSLSLSFVFDFVRGLDVKSIYSITLVNKTFVRSLSLSLSLSFSLSLSLF